MDTSTELFVKNLAENNGPAFHELPVDKCREVYKELVSQLSGELADIGEIRGYQYPEEIAKSKLECTRPKKQQKICQQLLIFMEVVG